MDAPGGRRDCTTDMRGPGGKGSQSPRTWSCRPKELVWGKGVEGGGKGIQDELKRGQKANENEKMMWFVDR